MHYILCGEGFKHAISHLEHIQHASSANLNFLLKYIFMKGDFQTNSTVDKTPARTKNHLWERMDEHRYRHLVPLKWKVKYLKPADE